MNYGLYLSASGVLTSMYRQDVFANNLANVQTVGFKPDIPTVREREPESVEGGHGGAFRQVLLDKLGGGVLAGQQRMNWKVGSPMKTENPLDAALNGENSFFVVQDPSREGIELTRDGRFTMDSMGRLVTTAGGHAVLDEGDRPIVLRLDQQATINPQGQVFQGGQVVAQIQVTGVGDVGKLRKQGENLLGFAGGEDMRVKPQDANMTPGFVEASGVDSVRALMDLVSATKAVSANGNMIRFHDGMMDRAVNTLGRLA